MAKLLYPEHSPDTWVEIPEIKSILALLPPELPTLKGRVLIPVEELERRAIADMALDDMMLCAEEEARITELHEEHGIYIKALPTKVQPVRDRSDLHATVKRRSFRKRKYATRIQGHNSGFHIDYDDEANFYRAKL